MTFSTSTSVLEAAKRITVTSEIFGDEIYNVASDLRQLWRDADIYGCPFTREIPNWWGSTVRVTAIPTKRRHSWSF